MAQLSKDMVKVPQMWRLAMEVHPDSVDVVMHSPAEESSFIYERLPLDPALSPLAAFEEMIYENPLLLSEFGGVEVLIDTPRYTFLPTEDAADDAVCEQALTALWPSEQLAPVAVPIPDTPDTLVMGVDPGLLAFIRRTFLDTKPTHPMAVLATYFERISRQGNAGKVYAHLGSNTVDVIGLNHAAAKDGASPLRIACTYPTPTVDDVVYFILASAKNAGFDLSHDEIMLCGDANVREQATPQLRNFASYVMPVIFPSEIFKAGKAALQAPFALAILPLCV